GIVLIHRVGTLEVGEVAVLVAVCAPHRGEAFDACREAMERVKHEAPIWKKEHFEGGEAWIEGCSTPPEAGG
ncbi:MAG: molybdenum cofactor biosynthesis protein MoaE, partial [Acidobacteriota bacterium]